MSNITLITGNLTADPILRHTPKGTPVCNARVINSTRYLDEESGKWKDGNTVAIDLEIWGKSGETFVKKAQKGTEVFVQGSLAANNYEDKETQKTIYGHRIKAQEWKVISRGRTDEPAEESTPAPKKAAKKAAKKTPKNS